MRLREAPAFYRVLLGHHDRQPVAEREVGGTEGMVVGKRVRDHFEPQRPEVAEEPRGVPDPGDGMDASCAERRRLHAPARIGQTNETAPFEPGNQFSDLFATGFDAQLFGRIADAHAALPRLALL